MGPAHATIDEDPTDRLRPEKLAAANINPVTRLATDYLNHFNDVVMMLELVPDMPECIEDVVGWVPVTYDDYFRNSHFRERELAVLAWENADPDVRSEFDAAVTHLDCAMAEAICLAERCDGTDGEAGERLRDCVVGRLKPLIATASAIVNGTAAQRAGFDDGTDPGAQAAIDELFH